MTELKRPERYVHFESIKPELKGITEFYTRKVTDYQHCLKQLSEYADALENEISVLKDTSKIEVLLDDTPKPLVEAPQIVADFIEDKKEGIKLYGAFHEIEECYGPGTELYNWVFQKSNGQSLFARAWIDGYTVKKEQLYEVVFYVDEEDDRCLLMKTGKTISFEYESQNEGHYQQQFTEAEIKEIDERYWAFAVEVDK